MSIAIWRVVFVPSEETFQVPAELFATTKKLLSRIADESYEYLEEGGGTAFFTPHLTGLPFTAREPKPQTYVLFDLVVRYFKEPTPEEDSTVLRYCGYCHALVRTLATCERCHVEEDPSLWRMGPSEVLYTRTFEIGYEFNGGPHLATQPEPGIEQTLRDHLGAVLTEIEQILGTKLVMKQCVLP